MPIPIIDLFAGPGGLGEGFSSVKDDLGNRLFQIKLSIEKDQHAHQTLRLRSFFRQFPDGGAPNEYYDYVKGNITLDELYRLYPIEFAHADNEAWCVTLGKPDEGDTNETTNDEIDRRISLALGDEQNWVLIGGPPCQAYSLVGRSRRKQTILNEDNDKRVGLYKEYLRIIAVHRPAVFVMENVKGLLSAKTEHDNIFSKILIDLQDPTAPFVHEINIDRVRYHIYSLSTPPFEYDLITGEPYYKPQDFLIKSENYGVPQKRHRVIFLGIRNDINIIPDVLRAKDLTTIRDVIGGLPKLRSGITRSYDSTEWVLDENGNKKKKRVYKKVTDNFQEWSSQLLQFNDILSGGQTGEELKSRFVETLGRDFIPTENIDIQENHPLLNWYQDTRLQGILHHEARKHLLQDIFRYYFAANFTLKHNAFPKMNDYDAAGNGLLPDHENARSGKFNDRFRVQMPDDAATTVTSHISKDGHYFIHYDPSQARSLTVREAARIQTFPDNYYFCGGRTQQYHQVGNAVPPFLATQIGEVVKRILLMEEAPHEDFIELNNLN